MLHRFRSALRPVLLGVAFASLALAEASWAQDEAPAQGKRFGMTEAERQVVFVELMGAERRAESEAAKKFRLHPESPEKVVLAEKLQKKYRGEIARKYDLGEEQLELIGVEGYEKQWRATQP